MATTTARTAPPVGEFATAAIAVTISMMPIVVMGAVMAAVVVPGAIVAVRLATTAVCTLPRRRTEGMLGDGDLLSRHLLDVAEIGFL